MKIKNLIKKLQDIEAKVGNVETFLLGSEAGHSPKLEVVVDGDTVWLQILKGKKESRGKK